MTGFLIATAARLFSGAQPRWLAAVPDLTPRVYYANHTSNFDFAVLWACLPPDVRQHTRPVAGRDYWERTAFRRWLAGTVFRAALIERKNVTRANNPVEPLARMLAEGDSLIIFPEGTRNPGPEVGEFKSGLYHILRTRPQTEAVPVYIDNLNRVLPKGEILPVPFLCAVTFGAPILLDPVEGKTSFLNRARDALVALEHS
jgi:1-acyl-sn-glycerol-3-phosphate acyltransferase